MSAWICSDKHIASVVCAYADKPEVRQLIADRIKAANIKSVNYRYSERTRFKQCDLSQAESISWVDVISLASSIDYQSCEHPSWGNSKARRMLQEILAYSAFKVIQGKNYKWSL